MSEAIREFVHQVEKTLITRRLYAPHMAPYQEAAQRLFEKCRAALGEEGFTLRVGPMDLFAGKTSLINRPKREDCFFFSLYRDGLRELTFSPDVTTTDLEALLTAFEAEEKRRLGPSEDTITFLWRRDLQTISYSAIDGIGDQEGDDEVEGGKDDYRALIADLTDKIKNPAPPSTGQSYAFVLDADVKVAAGDFHYEATTAHKPFEDNPAVLRLTAEEASALRAEMGDEREGVLLERFIEILLAILMDPAKSIPAATLAGVFGKLLEGYWAASDFAALGKLLARLAGAAQAAPHPETRAGAHEIVAGFLTADRIRAIFEQVQRGSLSLQDAARLWDHVGEQVWDLLVDFWSSAPDGPLRGGIAGMLKSKLAFHPDLLRGTLASPQASRVRAGLALLDERLYGVYAKEILALASHADEAIRLKGLAGAGRLGGPAVLEVVWRAMQGDPSKSVRLLAFRLMSTSKLPGLGERLKALVADPAFASRELWEREKYVRLLGAVAGDAVRPLFESWVPAKRWLWQPKDHEDAELALCGLAACGGAGLEKVQSLAAGGGKLGPIAKKALESAASQADAQTRTRPPEGKEGR